MINGWRVVLLAGACFVFALCPDDAEATKKNDGGGNKASVASGMIASFGSYGKKLRGREQIVRELTTRHSASVLVLLKQPASQRGMTTAKYDDAGTAKRMRSETRAASERVLKRTQGRGVKSRYIYENWAGFSATVTEAGLMFLLRDPEVVTISANGMAYAQ